MTRQLWKRLLKREFAPLRTLSRLFHLAQFVKSCQFFLKLNSKRQYQNSGKENESRLAFTSSTRRSEIRHFHVVVVQWRRRNVQKSAVNEQRFCFASLLIFAVLVAVRSLSLLKPPILYCLLGYWYLIWTVRILAKTKNTVNSSLFSFSWNHRQQPLCQLTKAALRLYLVRESISAFK